MLLSLLSVCCLPYLGKLFYEYVLKHQGRFKIIRIIPALIYSKELTGFFELKQEIFK